LLLFLSVPSESDPSIAKTGSGQAIRKGGKEETKRTVSHIDIPYTGKAGDLVIWHQFLPHGNSRNESALPRLAQYIAMFPTPNAAIQGGAGGRMSFDSSGGEVEPLRGEVEQAEGRVMAWSRGQEKEGRPNAPAATLTELGEKLLGARPWR
jgi:hypothetical protein